MKKIILSVFMGCLLGFFTAPAALADKPEPAAENRGNVPIRYIPQPPQTLTLCGEKVPLDDPFIAEQLDREFNSLVHDQAQIIMCLKRAGRYFPYITRELKAAGLPDDLKFLAVTESFLLHYVQSKAGALGLWQFMPATGRQYKLAINDTIDERLNPEKSTHAAIAYFKYLHRMFNNWALAMASYNCGQGKVLNELKEQGAKSYYDLYLPRETMRYVYRVMAMKIILSDPEAYGYHIPKEHIYAPYQGDSITLTVTNPLPLRDLAAYSKSTVRYLRELNPELKVNTLPKGSYQLLMPQGQGTNVMKQAQRNQAGVSDKPAAPDKPGTAIKPQQQLWQVKAGDTLSSIAQRFNVSVDAIKAANNIKGNNIQVGQKLVIPAK